MGCHGHVARENASPCRMLPQHAPADASQSCNLLGLFDTMEMKLCPILAGQCAAHHAYCYARSHPEMELCGIQVDSSLMTESKEWLQQKAAVRTRRCTPHAHGFQGTRARCARERRSRVSNQQSLGGAARAVRGAAPQHECDHINTLTRRNNNTDRTSARQDRQGRCHVHRRVQPAEAGGAAPVAGSGAGLAQVHQADDHIHRLAPCSHHFRTDASADGILAWEREGRIHTQFLQTGTATGRLSSVCNALLCR